MYRIRSLSFDASFASTVMVMLATIFILGLFIVALDLMDIEWTSVLRDSAMSTQPQAGLVSNIGIFLMALAGTFASVASLKDTRHPISGLALFCIIFATDDALLLHEKLEEMQVLVFLFYGLGLLLIWRNFSHHFGTLLIWPIIGVFVAFVGSAVIDTAWEWVGNNRPDLAQGTAIGYALEDLPKYAGITLLSIATINEALNILLDRSPKSSPLA